MNHTPGPWKVGYSLLDKTRVTCVAIGHSVLLESSGMFGKEETEANIRLCAAAPTAPHECDIPGCPGAENKRKLDTFDDLLAACETALPRLHDFARTGFFPQNDASNRHVIDKVETAIARAKGEAE